MRAATSPELALLLSGTAFNVHVRVWVLNADGTWINTSALTDDDIDFLEELEIDVDIDQPVAECTIRFKRDMGPLSLAPFREDSVLNRRDDEITYANLLDPGRDFYVETAAVAMGATPGFDDWKEIFRGIMDTVDAATDVIEVRGRDLGAYIADAWFAEGLARTYDGSPIEEIVQSVLDEGGMDGRITTVTVFTPESPGFLITAFKYDIESVLDAVVRLVQAIGWDVRYRWDDDTSEWRFTFQDPNRTNTTPDLTITKSEYIDIATLSIDRTGVRNSITIRWGPPDKRVAKLYEDGTSISRFKKRPMVIEEASDSAIDTEEEADRLGEAVLDDLADPKATQSVEMLYFWPVELQDLYRFTANDVHYDHDEDFAVTRYQHVLGGSGGTRHRTIIQVRGKPAGGYLSWIARAARGRPQAYVAPHPIIGEITAEGTARDGNGEGAMHVPIRFEVNTEFVLIYATEAPYDPDVPPPAPDIVENRLAHTVRRHEGSIASATHWQTEVDISTETDWARRIVAIPIGPTGLRGAPFTATIQCSDTGDEPIAPPTDLVVTPSIVDDIPQAALEWTNGDPDAETRVWRNGIVLERVAPGETTAVDTGISPAGTYDYRVQHIRDAQTSEFAGAAGVVTGSPTLEAPTWVEGYPANGDYDSTEIDPPPHGLVLIRFSNPDPLADTEVWMNDQDTDGGTFTQVSRTAGVTSLTLNAGDLPGNPTNLQRWFYLVSARDHYTDSSASAHETATFGF